MEEIKKVDEDWKQRAHAEKIDDDHKVKEKEEVVQQLPAADFNTFAAGLATEALMALGLVRDQEGRAPEVNGDHAKYMIDILQMLQEKTKGNLSAEETRNMDNILHQLRMAFVSVTQGSRKRP